MNVWLTKVQELLNYVLNKKKGTVVSLSVLSLCVYMPRGWLPYKKSGNAHQKFWKQPLGGGSKLLFCGCGLKFFTPNRYQFWNNILLPYKSFWLNDITGTMKALNVNLLRFNTLRGTKTAPSSFFLYGVPPPVCNCLLPKCEVLRKCNSILQMIGHSWLLTSKSVKSLMSPNSQIILPNTK